jgi:hypothetical protein
MLKRVSLSDDLVRELYELTSPKISVSWLVEELLKSFIKDIKLRGVYNPQIEEAILRFNQQS